MMQTHLEGKKQTKQQRKHAEKNKNRIENQRAGKLKKAEEEVARALSEVESDIQSLEEASSLKISPVPDDYATRVLRWETYLEKFVNYLPYEHKMTQDTAKGKSLASLFDAGLWHGQKAPNPMGVTPSQTTVTHKFGQI